MRLFKVIIQFLLIASQALPNSIINGCPFQNYGSCVSFPPSLTEILRWPRISSKSFEQMVSTQLGRINVAQPELSN